MQSQMYSLNTQEKCDSKMSPMTKASDGAGRGSLPSILVAVAGSEPRRVHIILAGPRGAVPGSFSAHVRDAIRDAEVIEEVVISETACFSAIVTIDTDEDLAELESRLSSSMIRRYFVECVPVERFDKYLHRTIDIASKHDEN